MPEVLPPAQRDVSVAQVKPVPTGPASAGSFPGPANGSFPAQPGGFDGNSTTVFQAKMQRAPVWFCSFLASNSREKRRLRDELLLIRGAWPLLMKQRNGGKWTPEEKQELKTMVRSASSVSPYLFIWALPGSVVLLPFLAWFLDKKRKRLLRKNGSL